MISHFKEPLDIASSNFSESTAIFGGEKNLREGLANVIRQYAPRLIGIAGTCLAETIGDDVAFYLRQIKAETGGDLPRLVHVSTPSYSGTHAEGFYAAVRALVDALAEPGPRHQAVNVLPGIVSPADLRYLKGLFRDFGLEAIVLPDYSDTLDGPAWSEYQRIPPGGTPIEAIRRMGGARATIEFGSTWDRDPNGRGVARRAVWRAALSSCRCRSAYANRPAARRARANLPDGRCPRPRGRTRPTGRRVRRRPQVCFRQAGLVYGEQDLVVGLARSWPRWASCRPSARRGPKRAASANRSPPSSRIWPATSTVLEGADFTEIEDMRPISISIWPSATARATGCRGGCRFRWFAWDFPSTTAWTGRGCCTSAIAEHNSCSIGSLMR